MECEKKEVTIYHQGKTITDQFYIDDDFNVPDAKCDVQRVLLGNGVLCVEEIKRTESYVRVGGALKFKILVICEGTMAKLEALEGQIPFEEMVYVEENEGNVFLKKAEVDFNVNLIHSRKLSIKALVDMELGVEEKRQEMFIFDMEEEKGLCKKYEEKEFLNLVTMKKDTYRIKEEITISATKEAVGTILWSEISPRKMDTRIVDDRLVIQGEVEVFCFYESMDEKIDWVLQVVPYEGYIDLPGVKEGMYHQIYSVLTDPVLDIRMDEDGEMRILGVEATLEAKVIVHESCQERILMDLYSIHKNYIPKCQVVKVEKPLLLNHSKCKVTEQVSVPEIEQNILQICHSSARIEMEDTSFEENGMRVEGVLHLWFLYVKADDNNPFDVWQGMIPFSHLIENGEMKENVACELFPSVEQINVGLLGNAKIEVKAVLSFQCFFKQPLEMNTIVDVEETELDIKNLLKQPGIIGYIVKPEDDLWKIAKKYRTTKERIIRDNQRTDESLNEGEKLLIFKEKISIL